MKIRPKKMTNFIQGTLIENPVTGRLEPKESPPWQRRAFRYLVSFPVIGMCLAMVFCVMFLMLRLQVLTIMNKYEKQDHIAIVISIYKLA